MKILLMLGWRNIWRNKRRSLVVISSIAFGIFAMILSMGFMNGMNGQMVENTIRTSLGHIALHRRGFQDTMKLRYNFRPTDAIIKAVTGNPEIPGYSPRITMEGIIRSSETSCAVTITGIDPEKEKKITGIYTYTVRTGGSRFLRGDDTSPVMVSTTLADKLGLVPGDRLVLMFQNKSKEIVGLGMTITGLYRTPVESFDRFMVFTTLSLLQKETGMGENITGIHIQIHHSRAVDRVKAALIDKLNDRSLEVLSWKDMAPNLVSAVKLFDQMMYIFFGIIFIVVIFSIANTLIMAIMERFHEIGVMKSIGTRPLWIFTMIMIEAVFLGIVGLVAGLIIGSAVTALLSATGIDFSFYMESMRTWGTGSIIYPSVKPMDIAAAVSIVMITTILAALYPAVKAARIRPLEALHFV